jgi:methionine sulfoxide reductase heme-binding subunit
MDVQVKPRRATTPILLVALMAAIAATVFPWALYGTDEPGLRSAIRVTARVGAVMLTFTFMISSLHTLARAEWSKWLLLHRRDVGLGFAIVQFVHLGIVVALAMRHTESFFATTDMLGIVGGSIGYVWLTAMVITSFDGPRKRIGPRGWRWLHTSGMYVLWGIFVFTYVGHVLMHPVYAILLTPLLVALAVRIVARIVKKSPSRRATLS